MKKIKKLWLLLVVVLIAVNLCGCSEMFDEIKEQAIESAKDYAKDTAENIANDISDKVKEEIENFDYEEFINKQYEKYKEHNVDVENLSGPYNVVRVVDGDTFVINKDGEEIKVRMIGVDTPESVATGKNAYKNCDEGKEASNYTKSLIEGKSVYLETDVGPTDNYRRTLAYVYLEDGTMLNDHLLEKGYARMMTIQPNVKYVDMFEKTQKEARKNKVGFWDGFETWEE